MARRLMKARRGIEVVRADVANQFRCEIEAAREERLELRRQIAEKDALIRMLVRGSMAEERVRRYEKSSDDVPF